MLPVLYSFSLYNNMPLYEQTSFYLSTHQLIDICYFGYYDLQSYKHPCSSFCVITWFHFS